jgi:rhamnogalacturonan endolyase
MRPSPSLRTPGLLGAALLTLGSFLAPTPAFAAFGYTDSGAAYVVDTGAGLVFHVDKANGDITSIVFNGVEYKGPSGKGTHIASGLGTPTTVTPETDGATYVKITLQTAPDNGVVATFTHYLVVRSGENTIYMATFPTAEPLVGELRWITRLDQALVPNGPGPSDLSGNTGFIESTDVFGLADGTTRSKYYGDGVTHAKDRAMDLTYSGATGPGIGAWMVFGSRESSSGGPFFRDIQNQAGGDQEVYNYMNSGHNQTEPNRLGVLHGPYALVFTTGAPPTLPIDFGWMGSLGLTGWFPPSGRGAVSGTVRGVPSAFQAVVGFANTSAQYWAVAVASACTDTDIDTLCYTSSGMKPGTYTATLYKGELAVATAPVTVTAGTTATLNLASTEAAPSVIFRIGDWDGTPAGLLNPDKIVQMHPSDVRMSSWDERTYTVGVDTPSVFPAIQFRGKNSPATIKFTLAPNQITALTLRIGITCAYLSGRPQIGVNSFTSTQPAASTQPNSRSFTIGTYRGNNALFTYAIPATALVAGTNTLTINPISGSTDNGTWLSAGWVYDAVELDGPIATPVIDYVGSSPLVVSGTAEPLRNVAIKLDGVTAAGSTVASASGAWTVTYSGAVSTGPHTFTAVASDDTGHSSPTSAAFAFDTRVTMPVIVAAAGDTGTYASGATTSDRVFSLSGSAGAGDTVRLTRVGTGVIGTAVADSGGLWSFDYTSVSLPDGVTRFYAVATHAGAAGAASPVFTLNLAGAPRIAIVRRTPAFEVIPNTIGSAVFRVTFNHTVGGVTTGAFAVSTTGTAAGTVVAVSSGTGSIFDVTVAGLSGTGTLRLDLAPDNGIVDGGGLPEHGYTAGEPYTLVAPSLGDGTWIRAESGGFWSDPLNWNGAVVADGAGRSASFASLDLAATNAVHLDGPRTVGTLTFGDTGIGTPASWILDGSGTALTLAGPVPTIEVRALAPGANATVSAVLDGTAGLTKAGPGDLVLAAANTLTGTVNVSAGGLLLPAAGSLALGASAVNLALNSRINVSGGSFVTEGVVTATTAQVVIDAGSARIGTFRTNSHFSATLRVNGGALSVGTVDVRRNGGAAADFTSGFIVAGTGTATADTIGLGTGNSTGAMSIEGNGSLLATGVVTLGNQVTGGRGGVLRVLGNGTFTSTEPTLGVLLCRTSGTNANNVASATFTGGVSTVEKITLGFDSTVTAGSATVTLNGGALYVGAGGIVKNGAAGMATNLAFGSGILGAKADWSTALAVTLPASGNVAIKAADAAGAAHDITLGGPLTGTGGFTKTGAGALALGGASTFSGPVSVNGGLLRIDGSVAPGSSLAVNDGGTLGGGGAVARNLVLSAGGTIAAGNATPGSALSASSLTWNGSGHLAAALGSGRVLALAGALTKGTPGWFDVALSAFGPLTVGMTDTLVTYASTDFAASDLTASGLAGFRGVFVVAPTSLQFLVTGVGETAAYTDWAYHNLPPDQRGAADDPDGDGLANLLEFELGLDAAGAGGDRIRATTVEAAGQTYPAIVYTRRVDSGGAIVAVRVAGAPDFTALLDSVEVSATPQGDGTDEVVARSVVPLSTRPRQFFRLAATLPASPTSEAATVVSAPVGVLGGNAPRGESGFAAPLIAEDAFVGTVESNTASAVTFAHASDVGALLRAGAPYYLEVLTGALQGERFDVDVAATTAGDGAVELKLGPGSLSTRPALAGEALAGARGAIRPT